MPNKGSAGRGSAGWLNRAGAGMAELDTTKVCRLEAGRTVLALGCCRKLADCSYLNLG